MAEAARHVNTMEAHHAPNWSRKQHVDGAHDRPSATSGSHGECSITRPTAMPLQTERENSPSPPLKPARRTLNCRLGPIVRARDRFMYEGRAESVGKRTKAI